MTELDSFNDKLLEGTSRSFYLTLKRLPKSVKGQIGPVSYTHLRAHETR